MSVVCAIRHDFGRFEMDVAFSTPARGITALFGASGAGKTTIANAIAGLLRPREGRIVIGGVTMFDSDTNVFVPADKRGAPTVFQDARLFPHMNVRTNLLFGWRRAKAQPSQSEIARVCNLLGLANLLDRQPAKLSGGEKSRVALGRALLAAPRLLLLDEPLAALDANRKAEILPYLEALRDEARVPMIYVTHSLDEVTRLADNVIVLDRGRIAAQGSVFALLPELETGTFGVDGAYGAVFEVAVAEHRADGLTRLIFDGGELLVPRSGAPVGAKLRVRLRAQDILLAIEEPHGISANNVLPVTVCGIRETGSAHADIHLVCGGVKMMARITRASTARLGIATGQPMFAVVKSVVMDASGARRSEI